MEARRLQKEFDELVKLKEAGQLVAVRMVQNDLYHWKVAFMGPVEVT